jgi:hypothetical protein
MRLEGGEANKNVFGLTFKVFLDFEKARSQIKRPCFFPGSFRKYDVS